LERTKARNYWDLIVWQKSIDLVESVYKATRDWPKDEVYGLTSQIRRAAVSVPSNIAEGQGRNSTREFLHHLSIAYGSLREVETQIIIAGRLNHAQPQVVEQLLSACGETGRPINGMINTLTPKNP
jgi:four helix bundle protein